MVCNQLPEQCYCFLPSMLSYSGIVTRVFTWFLMIYFTILIITESNIIKLDRRNNEGRKNK
jgi:hypothetical protein